MRQIEDFVKNYQIQAALLALVLLSIIWGYNWVVMKVALKDCGPFTFGAFRTFFGALTLFIVLFIRGGSVFPKAFPGVFLLGLLQTTGFVGFMMWALVAGGAGKTAVLVYAMPFWTLVLARLFLNERFSGFQWVAVLLAFSGLVLIFDPWHFHGNLLSEVLAVLSGMSWAASVVVAKRLQQKGMDLLNLTAWQMLFGSIPLVVVGIMGSGLSIHWTGPFIGALLYNIVPCNALAFLLWLFIVRSLPAGVAGMGSLITPLIGVFCAWVVLGETPGHIEGLGMLLISAALLILCLMALSIHCNNKTGIKLR
ncbi:MAG: DMT family transporter [Dehalobacter sp.]|nr:DMT family transporter [Dehalobacter sp.]